MNFWTDKFFVDVSTRSMLEMEGADGLDLLQRISTNNVADLKVGEHTGTILTSDKGRIVDLLFVFRQSADSVIITGASNDPLILQNWIQKFIVMEDVRLKTLNHEFSQILICNLQAHELTADLDESSFHLINLKYIDIPHRLFIVAKGMEGRFRAVVNKKGVVQATLKEYESFRIESAIPGFPNEISSRFNPLEVGLDSLVSFTKGCYVGQEVIARLDTYQKALRRFGLSVLPEHLPSDLHATNGEIVGILTSAANSISDENIPIGMGVVSIEHSEEELSFSVDDADEDGLAKPII